MKNKDIIDLIKQKANKKEIPNVSMLIKEKLNDNYQVQQEPLTNKKRFNLKALFASLSLVLATSIVIVLMLVNLNQNIDLFSNQEFSDQVILSAISTVELTNSNTQLNNLDQRLLLSTQEDNYVENQIDEVLKYSEFMEIYLNNDENYLKEIKDVSYLSYKKLLVYEFSDMLNETKTYHFYYKENSNKKSTKYQIKALLVTNEENYEIIIDGILDENTFTITHKINNNQKIEVNYMQTNNEFQLRFKMYNNKTVINESTINFNNKKQATLKYIKGSAKGTYHFEMHASAQKGKFMNIKYNINNQDQGEIDLLTNKTNNDQYEVRIKPNGRPESTVEKHRPCGPKGGKHHKHH